MSVEQTFISSDPFKTISITRRMGRSFEEMISDDWLMDGGRRIVFPSASPTANGVGDGNEVLSPYFTDLVSSTDPKERRAIALENWSALLSHLEDWQYNFPNSLVDARVVRLADGDPGDPGSYFVSYLHDFGSETLERTPYVGEAYGMYIGGSPLPPEEVPTAVGSIHALRSFYQNVHAHFGSLFDPASGVGLPVSLSTEKADSGVLERVRTYLCAGADDCLVQASNSPVIQSAVVYNPRKGDSRAVTMGFCSRAEPEFTDLWIAMESHMIMRLAPAGFKVSPSEVGAGFLADIRVAY
ncbi:hypothetical protein [Corynebacterium heidelbergense]|uniref:hypothetical protein n=1 Tax=Corynebacterium heidelbergense TaxID=2055947 RepID=UPI0011BF65F0|nr:hypothetical protein [Corynebacterium heidelbergense]WCZ37114.1 hypothetical protein CHEID_07915 [Corynebacterium heidelbergense]